MGMSLGAISGCATSCELCNSCKKFPVDGKHVFTIASSETCCTATYRDPYGPHWIDDFRWRL
jgi:hypothetical protein